MLTGSNNALIDRLLKEMSKEFRMTDMGSLQYFLGTQAQYSEQGLFLSQHKYAEDLLRVAGMLDCAPMPTPLPVQLHKVPKQDELFSDPTYFRSLAGKLQYLTLTRPDIQFSVNFVCQKMHAPTTADYNLLKRILRYVKGTITMGIFFNKNTDFTLRTYSEDDRIHHSKLTRSATNKNADFKLRAYSDSDHAGCRETRRSTGGFCTFLGNNIISWSSKKQPTVSKSSTEAEYRALSDATSEIIWLNNMLRDLHIPQPDPPELYGDNLSSIYLAANPVLHTRSKHFQTHYHFVRERVALGSLIVKHVPSHQQLADIFTKSLPYNAFISLRYKLGVDLPPTPSLQGSIKEKAQSTETELRSNLLLSSETSQRKVMGQGIQPSNIQKTTEPTKPNNRQSTSLQLHDKENNGVKEGAVAKAKRVSCASVSKIKTKNRYDVLSLLSSNEMCEGS